MKIQDRTGDVHGRLTVLSFAGQNKHGVSVWLCRCACGMEKVISSNAFRTGKATSCGCHKATVLATGRASLHGRNRTHGKAGTREYHIWANMIYRCHSPRCPQYARYGGRGIIVCQHWRDSFANFLTDMGPAPSPVHTVDRIDNDGPYSPTNCRWATRREQARNRDGNRPITANGLTLLLSEWSEKSGIHKATIHGRLRRGWPPEKAVGLA